MRQQGGGKIKAVILDVDGTLLDSNDAHAKTWQAMAEEKGINKPYEEVRALIGKGGDKLIWELVGIQKESEEGSALSQKRFELFRDQYLPQVQPFPKVKELVDALKAAGLRVAVGSSAKREELELYLEKLGIAGHLSTTVSSNDAEKSKPDPDIVAAAVEKLGVKPEEAAMVGDTPYDLEPGKKLGLLTIALRCGGFWQDKDLKVDADEIYTDPEDLLQHLQSSGLVASK
jgi:HAD superfamily hydrolase (TIGR01509 family)